MHSSGYKSTIVSGKVIPVVLTDLKPWDILGAIMVRWGIKRNKYWISPGLYAVGSPGPESEVLVTANYKLSFDNLRKNLKGLNAFILVLDTKGINVWCAAGKGTFGTKEMVSRIREVSLHEIVNHKRVIVPQLGATGVAAHKVREETGFNVHYGPVRASDICKFIKDGLRANKEMRKVTFNFSDRIKLIPNDFIYGKYYLLGLMALVLIISAIGKNGLSVANFSKNAVPSIINVFCAYVSGIVLMPALLPYIPVRPFSVKGFLTGLLVFAALLISGNIGHSIFESVSWFLIITAVSSFIAMNFTGSTTFTSLSGVKKEMKYSLPVQIGSIITGGILQIIGKIILE